MKIPMSEVQILAPPRNFDEGPIDQVSTIELPVDEYLGQT